MLRDVSVIYGNTEDFVKERLKVAIDSDYKQLTEIKHLNFFNPKDKNEYSEVYFVVVAWITWKNKGDIHGLG